MTKLGLPVATVDCSHGKGETPGDGRVGLGVRLNPVRNSLFCEI